MRAFLGQVRRRQIDGDAARRQSQNPPGGKPSAARKLQRRCTPGCIACPSKVGSEPLAMPPCKPNTIFATIILRRNRSPHWPESNATVMPCRPGHPANCADADGSLKLRPQRKMCRWREVCCKYLRPSRVFGARATRPVASRRYCHCILRISDQGGLTGRWCCGSKYLHGVAVDRGSMSYISCSVELCADFPRTFVVCQ